MLSPSLGNVSLFLRNSSPFLGIPGPSGGQRLFGSRAVQGTGRRRGDQGPARWEVAALGVLGDVGRPDGRYRGGRPKADRGGDKRWCPPAQHRSDDRRRPGLERAVGADASRRGGVEGRARPDAPARAAGGGLSGGKGSVWEGGIRVPRIIRGPGVAPGSRCHDPVLGFDLFPTCYEWARIPASWPDGIEGGSIAPLGDPRG